MASHRNRGFRRATALLCGLPAVAASFSAIAQEAPDNDDKAIQEVVVTGSRIVRAGYDTLEPASVVTGEYISSRGLTNIADALNESPGFGTGTTPEGGQSSFGPGLSFVNRFGLGSNRTLTLINGRRFVASNAPNIFGPAPPGSQVDLNFIPTILVDTIDNLAVGGAPTYGADAIAGVVNVKLKTNFEGIQAFAQYGQLEDGGMENNSVGLVGGWNFAGDRGNVTASIQHSRLEGLLAVRNDRFADAYSFVTNPSTGTGTPLTTDDDIGITQPTRRPDSDGRVHGNVPFNVGSNDGIANAVLIRDRRLFALNFGGVALPTGATNLADGRLRCFGATATGQGSCLQFAPDGNLVPYDPGVNFGTTDASGGDGLYLMETLPLVNDVKRTSATVSTHFDVTDNVQLFADLFAYTADSVEIVDQTAYNATQFGASSAAITLPANHPMLTQQARDTLAGLGQTSFRISRAHRDLAENNARSDSDLYQGVVGATGDFEAGSRRYNWEVYFNYGNNSGTFYSTQLNRQKFVNALNVIAAPGGGLQCSPTPNYTALPATRVLVGTDAPVADPNCVPLDIFGEGRPSPAALAYVSSVQKTEFELQQEVFNANIGSQLFDIWGGPIEYNVGIERRKESGDFAPDAYMRAGLGRSAAIQPLVGSYTTREYFGELIIPLVSAKNEIPFLNELTITGKGRRVDNEVNGKFTAWTGGLQWAPVEDLQFRGNVTRSLRAPSLTELFTPVSPLFTQVADPCSTSNYGAVHPRTATRQANCQQFFQEHGLPANGTWQSNAVTSTVQGTSQGDPGLANESANAWTVGFVARPRWVPGLELAVDWVDIRIDDAITNLSATDLATACFDNFTYPNQYCDYFTRNPASAGPLTAGQITFVQTGFANGAYQSMAGVTLEGRFRHDFEKLGTFEIGVSYYRLREELRSATGIVTTNSEEQLGSPTDSAQLNLLYEKGPIGARWQTNYASAALYNRTFGVENRDVLEVSSDYTHNLSVYFQPTDSATVRLAVTNILDGAPPFPVGTDSFNGNYDFLGRRYSLSLTYDFGGK
jgi:outer membrane receptor protein involved in Fe transport